MRKMKNYVHKTTSLVTLLAAAGLVSSCGESNKEPAVKTTSNKSQSSGNQSTVAKNQPPQKTDVDITKEATPGNLEQVQDKTGQGFLAQTRAEQDAAIQRSFKRKPIEGYQPLGCINPAPAGRALTIGIYRKGADTAYSDRGDAAEMGRPYFFVYDPKTGERVLDLSDLNVPESALRLSPDHTRLIVHYAKGPARGGKAVRVVYDTTCSAKIFTDNKTYDWADEPQFDSSGKYYFFRTGKNDVAMKPIGSTDGSGTTTVADNGVMAFFGQSDQPELLLIKKEGIQLFNPDTHKTVTLEATEAPKDTEAAWFFGGNSLVIRRNPSMFWLYKDKQASFWSTNNNFYAYYKGDKALVGWDKSTGKKIVQQNAVTDLKQDFMDPELLVYTVSGNKRIMDLRKPEMVYFDASAPQDAKVDLKAPKENLSQPVIDSRAISNTRMK